MPGSELEKIYYKGEYKPYTKEQTKKILIQMLKSVPRYCRVMRVMREIPPEYIVAGVINIDLRKDIEEEFREKNSKLKEIRYREIGFALQRKKKVDLNTASLRSWHKNLQPGLNLKITKYKASKGIEYFLEIVNKDDILFGLLRLRIVSKSAIVREIHVYGQSLKLGQEGKLGQHTGFGKQLIKKAEEITKKNKIKKLSVISGIGVREYYKKLGYELEGTYMIKSLKKFIK